MDRPRMRPRFVIELHETPERIGAALEDMLGDENSPCTGWVQGESAELHVREEDAHFFSPMLSLWMEPEGSTTALHGRFGPHPHVWMLFMAIYGLLGIAGTGGLVYGASQWMLAREPWALWVAPAAAALAAFVYGAAFIGQGLGAEQTHQLWSVVDGLEDRLTPATDGLQGAG